MVRRLRASEVVLDELVGERPHELRRLIKAKIRMVVTAILLESRIEAGNVVGLMPHPEHAVELLTGPTIDGVPFFTSVLKSLVGAP